MTASVFLDIDGVLSDLDRLSEDFDSLIGDVLAPVLGRAASDWGQANHVSFPRVIEHLRQGRLLDDPVARFHQESRHLIDAMCGYLGVAAPDPEVAADLGRRFNEHVRRNGKAGYPEAQPAIDELSASRDVHLATGNVSWSATAFLEQIGAAESIGIPCGTDLVGVVKESPLFYGRLFALAAVSPADAIVVDDMPPQLSRAASLGAQTILVSSATERPSGLPVETVLVTSISEVPEVVSVMGPAAVEC